GDTARVSGEPRIGRLRRGPNRLTTCRGGRRLPPRGTMRRRALLVFSLVVVPIAGALIAWRLAVRRADRYLEEAAARDEAPRELEVELQPAVSWDRPRPAGVACATAPDDARDGAPLGGRLWVATMGGLVEVRSQQTAAPP